MDLKNYEKKMNDILVDDKSFDSWKDIFFMDAMDLTSITEDDKEKITSFVGDILMGLAGLCKSSGVSFADAVIDCLYDDFEPEEYCENCKNLKKDPYDRAFCGVEESFDICDDVCPKWEKIPDQNG